MKVRAKVHTIKCPGMMIGLSAVNNYHVIRPIIQFKSDFIPMTPVLPTWVLRNREALIDRLLSQPPVGLEQSGVGHEAPAAESTTLEGAASLQSPVVNGAAPTSPETIAPHLTRLLRLHELLLQVDADRENRRRFTLQTKDRKPLAKPRKFKPKKA